jgi:hypothetical protein
MPTLNSRDQDIMKFRVAMLALAVLAFARPGRATYSITAVDRATRQVGGAGTSCISGGSVYRIYGSAPGFGAVNSQALASTQGCDEAVRLLAQGWAPDAIIQRLTEAVAARAERVAVARSRARAASGFATAARTTLHGPRSRWAGSPLCESSAVGAPLVCR